MRRFIFLFFWCIKIPLWSQQLSQNIRGQVIDKSTRQALPGASVQLLEHPDKGTLTDSQGYFRLADIALGRVSARVRFVGYQEVLVGNLVLTSAKEMILLVEMEESLEQLDEVKVRAVGSREQPINELAVVSARQFTAEETSRYAGAFLDPSRLVTNFAGVMSPRNDRNDIVVRGNSPLGVLWRLEGADIPSPNHFAFLGSAGGISMLNTNTLANSDFMTGAFPAAYGNRLAAAFDLRLRHGNNERTEYTGQLGLGGLEFGVEGPLSRKKHHSALVSYRFFSMENLRAIGINLVPNTSSLPDFQDLTFKINLPSEKIGTICVFGLGGLSKFRERRDDGGDTDLQSDLGVLGMWHEYLFSEKIRGRLTLSLTGTRLDQRDANATNPTRELMMRYWQWQAKYEWTAKLSARNLWQLGAIYNGSGFDFWERRFSNNTWTTRFNDQGDASLWQVYGHFQHRASPRLTFNAGVFHQYFAFNSTQHTEPRASVQYQLADNQRLALGFGLHSQVQNLAHYTRIFTYRNGQALQTNRELDMTKSRHWVLSYDWMFAPNFRLKTEIYHQGIYDAPINPRAGSYFSLLNSGASEQGILSIEDSLQNKGLGRNYGLEITVERFFTKNYYLLGTLSLFVSEYQGADGVWRNTAFGNQYLVNLLAGYEVSVKRHNALIFDIRASQVGGKPFVPIDLVRSRATRSEVRNRAEAYQQRLAPFTKCDLRISYRLNRPRANHYIFIELQNFLDGQNAQDQRYRVATADVVTRYQQLGFLPLGGYRVQFARRK
jgi:CarboxypepD_reg-like domain